MGFEEKIAELLRLREQGLLTQEEFDGLVKRAREDGAGGAATLAPPPADPIHGTPAVGIQTSVVVGDAEESSHSRKRAGVVAALLAIGAIVAVLVASGGESEPTKSKEYKELVVQQKDLERELSAVQADVIKLKDKAKTAQENHEKELKKFADEEADWLSRAENNRKALKELEALK